ncbi:glutamate receptor 4-like [Orbicella faveolata]|uniref:glutamate receptor 4-like n=1 Tax=Orbicella faveolata TaxID=48498 RepID=UPI0009E4F172|nr:glutamate receptor 4-like [Orbicella faveolata]
MKTLICSQAKLNDSTGPIHFNEYGKRKGIELDILNLRNNSFQKVSNDFLNSYVHEVVFQKLCYHRLHLSVQNIMCAHRGPSFQQVIRKRSVSLIKKNTCCYYAYSKKASVYQKNLIVFFFTTLKQTAPFVIRKKEEQDGAAWYEGYCIDLLNELARNLKFTYEIYHSPDGLYGAEKENGTWNGMIGELVNKRADIAVAALTITERRDKVVDFSVPYMYYTEEMLLKKTSSTAKIDYLQFLTPFETYVWFAILTSLMVISITLFTINYFSPYRYKDDTDKATSEEFSFFNGVWFALASLLQQGTNNTPRNLPGRILAGCYWFCILIWVSTYTANLAAFFSVKNTVSPINNLEDIVESSYQVGVYDSSSVHEAFKTSQYETHRKIWQRIEAENTIVQSTSEGSRWVRERDEFVFIDDGPILRHVANQPPCDLTVESHPRGSRNTPSFFMPQKLEINAGLIGSSSEPLSKLMYMTTFYYYIAVSGLTTAKGLALALQDNDPHTTDFTLAILRLHENRFLENVERKWWKTKTGCPQEQATMLYPKRIDLMSMLGVYAVLGVGVIVALLALIAEFMWKSKERKINSKGVPASSASSDVTSLAKAGRSEGSGIQHDIVISELSS